MVPRTVTRRPTSAFQVAAARAPAVRVQIQRFESAFPLTFLALAIGLAAGAALAGVAVPTIVRNLLPLIASIVSGV